MLVGYFEGPVNKFTTFRIPTKKKKKTWNWKCSKWMRKVYRGKNGVRFKSKCKFQENKKYFREISTLINVKMNLLARSVYPVIISYDVDNCSNQIICKLIVKKKITFRMWQIFFVTNYRVSELIFWILLIQKLYPN